MKFGILQLIYLTNNISIHVNLSLKNCQLHTNLGLTQLQQSNQLVVQDQVLIASEIQQDVQHTNGNIDLMNPVYQICCKRYYYLIREESL